MKDGQKIFLVNIYAPNERQSEFFKNLHNIIRKHDSQNLGIIGDFNAIFDIDLDRKSERGKEK